MREIEQLVYRCGNARGNPLVFTSRLISAVSISMSKCGAVELTMHLFPCDDSDERRIMKVPEQPDAGSNSLKLHSLSSCADSHYCDW